MTRTGSHAVGRLDPARAAGFARRLTELVDEFRTAADPRGPMYGLAVAFFQAAANVAPLAGAEDGR